MIDGSNLRRAVSVLLAGMALFLLACQPGRTLPAKRTESPPKAFVTAERYQKKGEFQQALIHYRVFLKENPRDKRTPLALQRIAEIHLKLENREKALTALERLSKEYPDHTWIPEIRYQISLILNQLGRYEASAHSAVHWLGQFKKHFLRKDVLALLGDDFCAMGEAEAAFFCWIDAWKDAPEKEAALDKKLETLVATSSPALLSHLLEGEREMGYPLGVYYQMSLVFLLHNELDQAEATAGALMRSTRDPHWIKKGEAVLARIKQETAICERCIGCLLPLTGPYAAYGREVLNGISLGTLTDPSVKGAGVEVIIRDTAGKPEKALSELEALVNTRKVVAVMGPLSSKTAASVSQRAQELGVPIIALTQRRDIVKTGDMVFRNFLTPAQEIDSLLQTAMGQLGLRRFGILYPDNAYGRFCMNLFWDGLDEAGGSVTAVESYPPDITDFADQIKKMVGLYYPRGSRWRRMYPPQNAAGGEKSEEEPTEKDPLVDFDALFIPDTYQRVAMIAPQLAFHDVSGVRLMGTRLWDSPKLLEMAGNYLQGAFFSSGFVIASDNPKVMGFVADYQRNFGVLPGILAANGYDTVCLLKAILIENSPETRDHLRQCLLDMPVFEGVTGPFSFDTEGEAVKTPLLLTISGGRAIPMDPFPRVH